MHDDRIDQLGRDYRTQLGEAPPAVTASALATFRARHHQTAWSAARIMLAVSAVVGLAIDLPVLLGATAHTSKDIAVLHVALAIGFGVAAWRPARYARGLAPVAVAAAVLLMLPTATDSTTATSVSELSHLPVLAGAAGLLLGGWLSEGRTRTRHA